MTHKFKLSFFLVLVSLGFHFYLAQSYYPLHFGYGSGMAACNANGAFNCEAVAASSYAALFGIPMAVWGLGFHFVLAMMMVIFGLRWTEKSEELRRWVFLTLGFSVVTSLVMGGVSFLLIQYFCLFCVILYALSILSFALFWWDQGTPKLTEIPKDITNLFGANRNQLIFFALIPVFSFATHQSFLSQHGGDKLDQIIRTSLGDWERRAPVEFDTPPSLVKGSSTPKMIIQEFADFRCGHCKHAADSLKAFLQSHSDVQLQFFTFPLDGQCNEEIKQGDGLSCRLAKATYCANSQDKGWEFHDEIFKNQSDYISTRDIKGIDQKLQKLSEQFGVSWANLETCIESSETHEAIRAQAELGVKAGVRGTPTIYVNGKRLANGQIIPVLKAARLKF